MLGVNMSLCQKVMCGISIELSSEPVGSEGGEVCGGAVTPGRGAGGAPGTGREEPGIRSFLTAMARPPAGAGAPAVLLPPRGGRRGEGRGRRETFTCSCRLHPLS